MLIKMYMKVSGRMIKLMVKESIFMLMVLSIMENGKTINNMEQELNSGPMVLYMKVSIMMVRNMAKGS
jgi:hypothetical protein